jgi:hypothetical protein
MSSPQRKNKTGEKQPNAVIYPHELAKGMKPGEAKMIGDDIYVIPVFVLDPPEPIKKPSKGKSRKK